MNLTNHLLVESVLPGVAAAVVVVVLVAMRFPARRAHRQLVV